MNALEKKTVQHILALIKSIDTYGIYRATNQAIEKNKEKVDAEAGREIMQITNESFRPLEQTKREAEDWLKILLESDQ